MRLRRCVAVTLRSRSRVVTWTVARARLDRRSDARFLLRRKNSVRARVALTQSDGWTVLATSAAVRIRAPR